MLTAVAPPLAPVPSDLVRRPLNLVVPGVSRTLGAVVARCLAAPRSPRYASVEGLAAALADVRAEATPVPYGEARHEPDAGGERFRALARRLGDSLAALEPPV